MSSALTEEERLLVQTVRAFIDRDVKPTVRDVEHANEYPEKWIEQMKQMGGLDITHVPYRGSGPMMIDLLAGTTQLSFENSNTALPQVAAGKLRALAVTSAKRSKAAPEIPTMQEAGLAGYDISSWQAMFAPAGTPPAIVQRLHAEVAEILKQPENVKKLAELGLEPGGGKPEELAALIAAEIPRLGNVVRQSGAKVD